MLEVNLSLLSITCTALFFKLAIISAVLFVLLAQVYSSRNIIIIDITDTDNSRRSEVFSQICPCICLSVCLSVCLYDNSKTNDPKEFKLGIWNDLGISYK